MLFRSGTDVKEVSFATWAMAFGTISLLLNGEKACSTLTGLMLENRVIAHANVVMDGLGWRRSSVDQTDFINRLKQETFVKEMATLAEMGIDLPCTSEDKN